MIDAAAFLKSRTKLQLSESIPSGSTVAFIDSSFNPPNNAHLALARICRGQFPQSYIVFMLATGNADKPTITVDQIQMRLQMMQLLVESEFPGDEKARLALTSEARFIDKAEATNEVLPKCRCIFAMGFDTLIRFADPKYYKNPIEDVLAQFFLNVEVVVLTRNEDTVSKTPEGIGRAPQQREKLISNPLFKPFLSKIHIYASLPETDLVSSSRARLSETELQRCVPPLVAEFIQKKKIYQC